MLQQLTIKLIAGEDLPAEESSRALEEILGKDCPDQTIAGFLTALSDKGETVQEIVGFARVMRSHAHGIGCCSPNLVDTAGTGGGVDSFNISTTAAFVISGAGIPVAKHGNRAVTSKSGSADILEVLGVDITMPREVSQQCLNEFGLGFLFAPIFHPSMRRVAGIRRRIGRRTIFNLLGPLTNPASAPSQIIGVYGLELTEKLGEALVHLDCQRAWVAHSLDGMDEISSRAVTRVTEVDHGAINTFDFRPSDYGYDDPPTATYPSGDPAENARTCLQILEGTLTGPSRNVVVLNAAAGIHVATEDGFEKALNRAEESLDSGAALEKLRRLVETSRRQT